MTNEILGRVLVVDDEPVLARGNCIRLKRWGYDAEKAVTSREAEKYFTDATLDVALLDVVLDEKGDTKEEGVAIAKRLWDTLSVPTIYLTAHSDEEKTRTAIEETNHIDVLKKPVDYDALGSAIKRGMAIRSLLEDGLAVWIQHVAEVQREYSTAETTPTVWVEVYQRCCECGHERIAWRRLIAELCGRGSFTDWMLPVVVLAEDAQFDEDEASLVAPRLLEVANSLRNSNRSDSETTVLSALRTYSSLISSESGDSLAIFLQPNQKSDTLLVALKQICRLFEVDPPKEKTVPKQLHKELHDVSIEFTKQRVIGVGENSTVAINAIVAAAATGYPNTPELIGPIRDSHGWIKEELLRRLNRLQRSWELKKGVPNFSTSALRLLRNVIVQLQS